MMTNRDVEVITRGYLDQISNLQALLREARHCVEYCRDVDDGSWAQINPNYVALLERIDASLLPQNGRPE